jgi:hypothetical protein
MNSEKGKSSFPYLAKIAKNYLGIQALSVAFERMFSIYWHISPLKKKARKSNVFRSSLLKIKGE